MATRCTGSPILSQPSTISERYSVFDRRLLLVVELRRAFCWRAALWHHGPQNSVAAVAAEVLSKFCGIFKKPYHPQDNNR